MKIYIILFFLLVSTNANECFSCHNDKKDKCQNSNHFSMKNAINITRKAWGIEKSDVTLQTLPDTTDDIKEPKDLVDDLLRRKCLRCHLTSPTVNNTNNSCLACHTRHLNKFDAKQAKAEQKKCLVCHTNEFIGSDYLGMFPHDYDKSYRSPITPTGLYPQKQVELIITI